MIAAVGLFLVPLAACGSSAADGQSSANGLSGTISVGADESLSGAASFVGTDAVTGIKLAVDQVNASGTLGKAKLNAIIEDTASETGQAVSLAQTMVSQDHVSALIGFNLSNIAVAAEPVAANNHVPMLTDTVVGPASEYSALSPYAFQPAPLEETSLLQVIKDYGPKHGWKSVVIFEDPTITTEIPQTVDFASAFRSIGAKVFPTQIYAETATDFSAQLTQVKAEDPSVIVLQDIPQISAGIMRQARQLGITSEFVATSALQNNSLLQISGSLADGTVMGTSYTPSLNNPANKKFVSAYEAQYHHSPDLWAAEGYMTVEVLADAIAAANSADPQRIQAALSKLRGVPTIMGSFTFNPDRTATVGTSQVLTVRGGQFVGLGTP
jgi:branched-chain amino acid transport system substrate-binding protein